MKSIKELSLNQPSLPNFLHVIQVTDEKFVVYGGPQVTRVEEIYAVHVSNVHSSEKTNLNYVTEINY